MRHALPPAKRIAIIIRWIAPTTSFSQIALYANGKSAVAVVVHYILSWKACTRSYSTGLQVQWIFH